MQKVSVCNGGEMIREENGMQDICAGQIKEIYNLLGDNISKSIFENRLMYSLTEDARFIKECSMHD